MLDPQSTLVQRLVGAVLLPRELLAAGVSWAEGVSQVWMLCEMNHLNPW
jgi:hypothetical protein